LSKLIEIVVSPSGQSKLETRGFAGGECREASRLLIEALGLKEQEQVTAEFHAAATNSQSQNQQHS
jgi:hypothetical protein